MVPEIRRLRGDLMRLSAEAAEFPALREGRQTLYDLNTRLARQLADLQHRSPGAPNALSDACPADRCTCGAGLLRACTALLQRPAIRALSCESMPACMHADAHVMLTQCSAAASSGCPYHWGLE